MAANKLLNFQAEKLEKKPPLPTKTAERTVKINFKQLTAKNKVLGLKGMTSW